MSANTEAMAWAELEEEGDPWTAIVTALEAEVDILLAQGYGGGSAYWTRGSVCARLWFLIQLQDC